MSYLSIYQRELENVSDGEVDFFIKTSSNLSNLLGAGLIAGGLGVGGISLANSIREDNAEKLKKAKEDQLKNNLLSAALGAGAMWFAREPIKGFFAPSPDKATQFRGTEFDEIWKNRRKAL